MMWTPQSWQTKPISQMPDYPNPTALRTIVEEIKALPPLVTDFEIRRLKKALSEAQQGKAFVMQGGDCAESFQDINTISLTNKLKIILQMSLLLVHGLQKPIIRVGRIAGQYAKPRSQVIETKAEETLPVYRGDLVNSAEFNAASRTPDPQRLMQAYYYSALSLNYLRALIDGGFADLHHPEYWALDFFAHSPYANEYRAISDQLLTNLNFAAAADSIDASLNRIDFYTSHEALNLYYEEALTHRIPSGQYYNLGTHFPWLGMRTIDLENAHIEYLRGIENPIGIKLGPSLAIHTLLALLDKLNPNGEAGKIMLIHRFGKEHIQRYLPAFLNEIKKTQQPILWCLDPMHGNTKTTSSGIKTRYFDDILAEIKLAFAIHQDQDVFLSGIHFEMTGENVTECIGGARGLSEKDLGLAYKSLVDPRLNYDQSLEMAMQIARINTSFL